MLWHLFLVRFESHGWGFQQIGCGLGILLEMELDLSLQTGIVMNHQFLCVFWVPIFLVSAQTQVNVLIQKRRLIRTH